MYRSGREKRAHVGVLVELSQWASLSHVLGRDGGSQPGWVSRASGAGGGTGVSSPAPIRCRSPGVFHCIIPFPKREEKVSSLGQIKVCLVN